jgi:hypothetical protein
MMDIQAFHKFNRMVKRGDADPIVCEVCDNAYVLRADQDAQPYFECFFCNVVVHPSLRVYDEVCKIVKEHY